MFQRLRETFLCFISLWAWEIKGQLLTNGITCNPNRFVASVWHKVATNRQNFAMYFIGPASIVSECISGHRNIIIQRRPKYFPIVQGFQRGQMSRISFNQVCKLTHEPGSVRWIRGSPRRALTECRFGSFDGHVNIRRVRLWYGGDQFFSWWVEGVKSSSAFGINIFVVDEELELEENLNFVFVEINTAP